MHKSVFAKLVVGTLGLAASVSAPMTFAVAHEGHQMECSETSINAMKADIQSMSDRGQDDGMKEMQMAQDMMVKNDMKGCMTHMDNAMDATEK